MFPVDMWSESIATGFSARSWGNRFSIPGGGKRSVLHSVQPGPGAHPGHCPKDAGACSSPPPLSSVDVDSGFLTVLLRSRYLNYIALNCKVNELERIWKEVVMT
jgi:hypothetical protein